MLLMGLVMNSYGTVWKKCLSDEGTAVVDTGIVVSRRVAEGCFVCVKELKAARDSIVVLKEIGKVDDEVIDWILVDEKEDSGFRVWWDRSKRVLRGFGVGVLVGAGLVVVF